MAKLHQSPVEAKGGIQISRTVELHHMLLLTGKQLHLNLIQVCLQCGRFIFQDWSYKLIVCSSMRPVHVASTGFFSSWQLQRDKK